MAPADQGSGVYSLLAMLSANLKTQATPSTSSSLERKVKPTWMNFVFTLYNVAVDWLESAERDEQMRCNPTWTMGTLSSNIHVILMPIPNI